MLNNLIVTNTRPEHAAAIQRLDFSSWEDTSDCFTAAHIRAHIKRFPEGQFVALLNGHPVGFAVTMRTNKSPHQPALPWFDAVGDMTLRNPRPDGQWLYGVEFVVDPNFRRRGIGTRLYKARFNLVKRLNLRGFYAGGMLAGYHRYHRQMTVREYGQKVRNGELKDPTVTMQINRGFKPAGVIENYCEDDPPYDSAMLIVWDNPQYQMAVR